MKELLHTIPSGYNGKRLDRYLCDTFVIFPSRKSAYKLIKKGLVRVNGHSSSPNKPVHENDGIRILLDNESSPVYKRKLHVLYEDQYMAVVLKPPGMLVNGNCGKTIEKALPFNLLQSSMEDALSLPAAVHRLDRPTGGLLVVAKTAGAMMNLSRQFQERRVKKVYRALVKGKIEGTGIIEKDIDNRTATTGFFVIDNIPSLHTNWITYLELYPRTGRTHQIRKHLADLEHPVLGDKQYNDSGPLLRGKGLFLWATGISIQHPAGEWLLNVHCEVPGKFITYIEREKRRFAKFYNCTC